MNEQIQKCEQKLHNEELKELISFHGLKIIIFFFFFENDNLYLF